MSEVCTAEPVLITDPFPDSMEHTADCPRQLSGTSELSPFCVQINFLSKVILEKMCWFPRVIYVLDLFEQFFPVHVALI